jgi:hypothetical protein
MQQGELYGNMEKGNASHFLLHMKNIYCIETKKSSFLELHYVISHNYFSI